MHRERRARLQRLVNQNVYLCSYCFIEQKSVILVPNLNLGLGVGHKGLAYVISSSVTYGSLTESTVVSLHGPHGPKQPTGRSARHAKREKLVRYSAGTRLVSLLIMLDCTTNPYLNNSASTADLRFRSQIQEVYATS
jgi:hypothetical protein